MIANTHIVFLSPHSDPQAKIGEVDAGGQCIYEYELGKSLSRLSGNHVTIYCRRKFNYPPVSVVNRNLVIKRISCGGEGFIPKEQIGPVLEEFSATVAADLENNPADIVHSHYWDGGKAAIHLSNHIKNRPVYLWTPHSLGTAKQKKFPGVKNETIYNFIPRIFWENSILQFCDQSIVSTEDERDQIIRDYEEGPYLPKSKVRVIAPGISETNFAPIARDEARRTLKLPADKKIIMTLGRMDKRKGYANVIRSFFEFKLRSLKGACLVIFAGNAGSFTKGEREYAKELKNLVSELGLQNDVIMRDALDYTSVRLAYAAADLYMCLSEYEGFGLAILESMYMGTPVIATSNGGPRNIITQLENGILVNSYSYSLIAAYMDRLMTEPDFYNMISVAGQKFVAQNYTWDKKAVQFMSAYRYLAKSIEYAAPRSSYAGMYAGSAFLDVRRTGARGVVSSVRRK